MPIQRHLIDPIRRAGYDHFKRRSYWRIFFGIVMAFVLLVAVLWASIRIFGLPDQAKNRVLKELQQRGITLDVKRFYFDAFGRLVARDVVLLQAQDHRVIRVEMEKIRF